MSKRNRGTGRPVRHRPGTRAPSARPASGFRPARPAREAVSEPVEAIEAGLSVSSTEASTEIPPSRSSGAPNAAAVGARPSTHSAHHRLRAKPGSLLAARAESEYVYVAQDLRRITVVAAVLAAILIGLWVILVLMGASPLY